MLAVVLVSALLIAVGWALGRAPFFRLGILFITVLAWLAAAVVWAYLIDAAHVDRALRAQGRELDGWGGAALFLVPPLLPALALLGWLRRKGRPRALWAWSSRPATLSLRGIVAVQAGLLLAIVVLGNAVAAFRELRAEKAWEKNGHALSALPGKYSKTPTNAAGREIERLAAELGLPIRDDSSSARGKPSRRFVADALSSYVLGRMRRPDDVAVVAPLEARAWLAMNATGVEAVEGVLLGSSDVVWETDIDAWQTLPLFGLRNVHAALLACAYEAARQGHPDRARRALEAAFRLTGSLRERPHTSARLLALAQDREWLAALRALGTASDEWEPQFVTLADSRRPLQALPVESRSFLQDGRGPRTTVRGLFLEGNWALALLGERARSRVDALFLAASGGAVGMNEIATAIETERARAQTAFYRWGPGVVEKPYLRLCAADYASASAGAYARAAAAPDSCSPLPEPAPETAALSSWNLVGGAALTTERFARSGAALGAEVELTRHVLRARALRGRDPARAWPTALSGLESAACGGRNWIYERTSEGGASLRLQESPFEKNEATVAYRLSAS